MGKTGECYLVGPDLLMRSRSRFMVEDREAFIASLRRSSLPSTTVDQIERQGNVINQLPVRTPAAEDAIRGREGLAIIIDYRGVPVIFHTDHIKGPDTIRILSAAIRGVPLRATTISLDSSELSDAECWCWCWWNATSGRVSRMECLRHAEEACPEVTLHRRSAPP